MKHIMFFYKLALALIVLLAALALFSSAQPVLAAGTATFDFTSSPNPSGYHAFLTFTLTATGDQALPPFGYVAFYDGDTVIPYCELVELNHRGGNPNPGIPAVCTTMTLGSGTHTIRAVFGSIWPDGYEDATLTLQQIVNEPIELTITPDKLPDAAWGTHYLQPLNASPGDGTYDWTWTGNPPAGIHLWGIDGKLDGSPVEVGEFRFTVSVDDHAGGLGTKDYTLTVTKAAPQITVHEFSIREGDKAYLDSEVRHPAPYSDIAQPGGRVAFSVDDVQVPGCSGESAVQIDMWQYAGCQSDVTTGLSAGDHTIKAEYVPDADSSLHYASATGTATVHVLPIISGLVFNDLDKDGSKDGNEPALQYAQVNLDRSCDGTVDRVFYTYDDATFSFRDESPGLTYCLTAQYGRSWSQTTIIEPFTLDVSKSFEIGMHEMTISPEEPLQGEVGVAFNQVITVSGGKAPYAFTIDPDCVMPPGVTYAVDGNGGTLTLSGTPTMGGFFPIDFEVKDAGGSVAEYWNQISIPANGSFTFTSSPNPSESGQAVTFTLTATGEAYFGGSETVPPVGFVDFYDTDTVIAGCEQILLNYDPNAEPPMRDHPAVCTTSALADGTHTIKATFTHYTPFRNATVTLEQHVGATDTTPPVITSKLAGTLGPNGWYTSDVNLIWTVSDPESNIISTKGCEAVTVNADQKENTYTCSATSAGGTSSANVMIKRDTIPPQTTVTGVTEGSQYVLGNVPQAGCSSTDQVSGVMTEATLALTGGGAQGVGNITATCSGALDAAGNAASPAIVHYTVTAPPASADLKLSMVANKDRIMAGNSLVYTLKLKNLGPMAANSVTLVDTLDSNITFVSLAAPKGWTCTHDAGIVRCTKARWASGNAANIVVNVKLKRGTGAWMIVVNTAEVSSATDDPNMANNSAKLQTKVAK